MARSNRRRTIEFTSATRTFGRMYDARIVESSFDADGLASWTIAETVYGFDVNGGTPVRGDLFPSRLIRTNGLVNGRKVYGIDECCLEPEDYLESPCWPGYEVPASFTVRMTGITSYIPTAPDTVDIVMYPETNLGYWTGGFANWFVIEDGSMFGWLHRLILPCCGEEPGVWGALLYSLKETSDGYIGQSEGCAPFGGSLTFEAEAGIPGIRVYL